MCEMGTVQKNRKSKTTEMVKWKKQDKKEANEDHNKEISNIK